MAHSACITRFNGRDANSPSGHNNRKGASSLAYRSSRSARVGRKRLRGDGDDDDDALARSNRELERCPELGMSSSLRVPELLAI